MPSVEFRPMMLATLGQLTFARDKLVEQRSPFLQGNRGRSDPRPCSRRSGARRRPATRDDAYRHHCDDSPTVTGHAVSFTLLMSRKDSTTQPVERDPAIQVDG